MHEHSLDLIAALADGSLSDETEARALVETCETCREEYNAQQSVVASLAAVPPAAMTDLEKAALHRDLWTELRSETADKRSGMPWWQRLSYVAAALFIGVGLVSVFDDVRLEGGDAAADTTIAGEIATFDSAGGGEEIPFAEDSGAEGGALQEEATVTTAAASEALPIPFEELAEEARAGQTERVQTLSTDEEVESCLPRIGLREHVVVDEIESDRTYLLVMPKDPEAEPIVTFVALPGCEIVYVG